MSESHAETRQVFSERYRLVAEANRRVYDRDARGYNDHVACVTEGHDQAELQRAIERAVSAARERKPSGTLKALDACGGSGNAALRLHEAGCDVVLSDISREMTEVYHAACEQKRYPWRARVGEIGQVLTECRERFDIIVFSSALHHLEDPVLVLGLAQRVLSEGGVILTIFDPVKRPLAYRMIREPFRVLRRAVKRPELIAGRAIPVLKRMLGGGNAYKKRKRLEITEENMGNLAEFHGGVGFDDKALAARIEQRTGLQVLRRDRFHGGVHFMDKMAWRLFGIGNRFSLLLRNQDPLPPTP